MTMPSNAVAGKIKAGVFFQGFILPDLDGAQWSSCELVGKRYLVIFYRFAFCPFGRLRIKQLVARLASLPREFHVVVVVNGLSLKCDWPELYDEHGELYTRLGKRITIVNDKDGALHEHYAVGGSKLSIVQCVITRFPTLLYAVIKYPKSWAASIKDIARTPAYILINESGTVTRAHYGHDAADTLPFKDILYFAKNNY